jgi:polyhydroxyalkanoate synthase subunit PhaC
MAGHSLGGTLAAIFASLHPGRLHGRNVPGTALDLMSAWADPVSFSAEPWMDLPQSSRSADARRLHWQVRRWSLDESPMARRLFEEVEEALYRQNRFAEGRSSTTRATRA